MRCGAAVAVKVSPDWTFHDVFDNDPVATFSHVASALSARRIAYLHVGNYGMDWDVYGMLRRHFQGPQIAVGGFTRAAAAALIGQGTVDLVAYGQTYIANPGLDLRYRNGLPINRPDIATYYTQGAPGYTDYPVHAESDPALQLPTDSAPIPISADVTG